MHVQLQAVADGLLAARARLHRLAEATSPGSWSRRADPDRWVPIHRVKVTSLSIRGFATTRSACLTILPPHQERHIRQAERVLERLRSGK